MDTTDYELYRIPAAILPALKSRLQEHGHFFRAWLQAVSSCFPGRSLVDVLRHESLAFPPCSEEEDFACEIQVCTAKKL
jgi:hypothetical protein